MRKVEYAVHRRPEVEHTKVSGEATADRRTQASDDDWALERDRDLLVHFRAGDRAALHEVFKRYLPVVMRALRGGARTRQGGARRDHGLDEMELENLAHDTFIKAFAPSARERYDGIRPYSAYIATIAKNLLIDEARKRGRRPGSVALDDAPPLIADAPDAAPEHQAEATELQAILTEFLHTLNARQREVFDVRFVRQRSLRESAADTGISLFTLRRIDAKLRVDLLATLRAAGFLENVDVRIGQAVLDRRGEGERS